MGLESSSRVLRQQKPLQRAVDVKKRVINKKDVVKKGQPARSSRGSVSAAQKKKLVPAKKKLTAPTKRKATSSKPMPDAKKKQTTVVKKTVPKQKPTVSMKKSVATMASAHSQTRTRSTHTKIHTKTTLSATVATVPQKQPRPPPRVRAPPILTTKKTKGTAKTAVTSKSAAAELVNEPHRSSRSRSKNAGSLVSSKNSSTTQESDAQVRKKRKTGSDSVTGNSSSVEREYISDQTRSHSMCSTRQIEGEEQQNVILTPQPLRAVPTTTNSGSMVYAAKTPAGIASPARAASSAEPNSSIKRSAEKGKHATPQTQTQTQTQTKPTTPLRGSGKKVKPHREEEDYVIVLERNVKNRYYNRYQCKRCNFIFEGNADLIQRHITGIRKSGKASNRGLNICPNPDPVAYAKYVSMAAAANTSPVSVNKEKLKNKSESSARPPPVKVSSGNVTTASTARRRSVLDSSPDRGVVVSSNVDAPNPQQILAAGVALKFLFRK